MNIRHDFKWPEQGGIAVARRCRPLRMFMLICVLLLMVCGPARGQTKVIAGPMLGHVSDTSARLWMQLNTSEDVSVRIVDAMNNRPMGSVRVTELESPFIFDTPLPGLLPNHTYRIEVFFDDKPADMPDPPVLIRSAPPPGEPTDFTVAFGSSLSPGAFPKIPVIKAILAEKPRAFLSLGNLGYLPADAKAWPKTRREAARLFSAFQANIRATPDLQPLFRSTPVYAVWSEHDFGFSGADGSFPYAREALTTFMRYWPNPDYGTASALGVYHALTLGDVDFFMLDDHSYRLAPSAAAASAPSAAPAPSPADASRSTLYGNAQLAWLKKQLSASTAVFKIIASGSPFLPAANDAGNWSNYPEERAAFFSWLFENHITGVILLSGNRGLGELSVRKAGARNSGQYAIYELTSSPLAQEVAEEARGTPNPLREGPVVAAINFGTLEFAGPKSNRHVTLHLRDETGRMRLEKILFAAELQGP